MRSRLFLYFLPIYYIYNMTIDVVFTRGGMGGILINLLILTLFAYLCLNNPYNTKFIYLYVWLLLNLVLILCNSSDVLYSLKEFGKNVIGILCFPLSFYLIYSSIQVRRFFKVLIGLMILYIVNLVLANTMDWGQAYGGTDNVYAIEAGAAIVTGSMPIVMALMMAPFILQTISRKTWFIVVWAGTTISILFIFKRTNIAALFVGYILIFLLNRIFSRKNRINTKKRINKKNTILLVIFGILLTTLFVVFDNIILAQFEYRSKALKVENISNEGRIIEWYLVRREILDSNNISVLLFGKEPYNTKNNYGFRTDRNIHGDFSMILFSTGVIGFIIYWVIQVYIALLVLKYNKRRYLMTKQDIYLFIIYLSTSAIWFLFCFSATLGYVLISSVYYMIHGMILRYFWNKHQLQQNILNRKY